MYYNTELYHHGILGQKWGIRRYQNKDGTLTEEGKKRVEASDTYKKNHDTMIKEANSLIRSNKDLSYEFANDANNLEGNYWQEDLNYLAREYGLNTDKFRIAYKNYKSFLSENRKLINEGADIVDKILRSNNETALNALNEYKNLDKEYLSKK